MKILDRQIKSKKVIDQLRRVFPGKWKYNPKNSEWIKSDGTKVYSRACIWGEGEDNFYSQWYMEYPDGKIERLSILGLGFYI